MFPKNFNKKYKTVKITLYKLLYSYISSINESTISKKKIELKSCHDVTWEDNYSWIHQQNILEVLKINQN